MRQEWPRLRKTLSLDFCWRWNWRIIGRSSHLALRKDVSHAANLGTDAAEFLFDAFVAAIHVIDAVEDGLAIGDEGSQHKRGGCAQVGTHDCGRGETGGAAHGGGASIHLDVGAHAHQFLHMHETIFEDVFADLAYTFSLRGEGHVL